MDEVKKQWLPRVIMAPTNEFEQVWEEYMTVYHNEVDIEAYEKALTEEVRRRVEAAQETSFLKKKAWLFLKEMVLQPFPSEIL